MDEKSGAKATLAKKERCQNRRSAWRASEAEGGFGNRGVYRVGTLSAIAGVSTKQEPVSLCRMGEKFPPFDVE